MFAAHGDAADRFVCGRGDLDFGELFFRLLVEIQRLAGTGIDVQCIPKLFAILFDGFDPDDLRLCCLMDTRIFARTAGDASYVAELDVTLPAIQRALGLRDIARGTGARR